MSKILQGGFAGKRVGTSGFWPRSCGVGLTLIAAFGIAACAVEQGQENQGGEGEAVGSIAQAIVVSGPALLVVGSTTLSTGDAALSQRLTSLGLTVIVKAGTAVTAADGTGKLVVISDSVTSGDVNTKFRTSASPVVNMESALFDDLAMTGIAATEYGTTANQTSVLLLGTPGSLVGDVTVPVTSSAKTFTWGRAGANAKRVAVLASDPSASTIFAYEKGVSMVGLVAPARRVGWFATGDAPASFNASAWSLFDAAINWAASKSATPDCSAANSCGLSDGAGGICTGANGKCVAKPNATGSCSGSSCSYACTGLTGVSSANKTLSCSTPSQPSCGSWDFESNTAEGWYANTAPLGSNNAMTGALFVAASPSANGGARSLAVNVDGTTGKGTAGIGVDFCSSGFANSIQGRFHMSVWFKPTDGGGGLGGPGWVYLNDGTSNVVVGGDDTNCPANQWFDLPTRTIAGTAVRRAELYVGGIEGRKGVLYFDNAYFE